MVRIHARQPVQDQRVTYRPIQLIDDRYPFVIRFSDFTRRSDNTCADNTELQDVGDLAHAKSEEIITAAQEDGIRWYETHKNARLDEIELMTLGEGRAFNRGVRGSHVIEYKVEFAGAIESEKKAV